MGRILWISVLVMLALGCRQNPTKVAVLMRMESGSILGMSSWDNVKMVQADGSISDMEFIPFDDNGNPDNIPSVYKRIREQGIRIIITAQTSTLALRLQQEIEKDTVPVCVFASGSATEKLSGIDDYTFRIIPDLIQEQKSIAGYIMQRHHKNLLVVVDTKNPAYSEVGFTYFKSIYTSPIQDIHLHILNFNVDTLEANLSKREFDAIYLLVGDYQTNAGVIAQLANKIKPGLPIYYTPWMLTQNILATAGSTLDHSVMPSLFPSRGEAPAIDAHIQKFHKLNGYYPSRVSLNVVKIMDILQETINNSSDDPVEMKKYLMAKRKFQTRFGMVAFNEFGDNSESMYYLDKLRKEFE